MKRVFGIGLLAAIAILTAGCTDTAGPIRTPPPTGGPSATPSAMPTAEGSPQHYVPVSDEEVLASLDDVAVRTQVGEFLVTRRNAVVYLTCVGVGEIKIEIDPVGVFPLRCEDTGAASENQFEVLGLEKFSVTIDPRAGQRWAVTVTTRD